MRSRALISVAVAMFVTAVHVSSQQPVAPPPAPAGTGVGSVDFATEVQPILRASCLACHSGERAMGQLRLDVRSGALKGGTSGPIITPGDSKNSRLIHRVLGLDGQARMPMGKEALPPETVAVLARWIDAGAPWPDALANETNATTVRKHWAYVPPVRPALPAVQNSAWVRNPIDAFVLARLEKEGVKPSAEATRETIIRRVSLDLVGLPPSPTEIDAFVNDAKPDAYDRLVERLLASPRYGERWATPWLDLARYADSDGYDKDSPRTAWPYRDWVVKAFNQNMSFDQFTIEQLAGDLLPNATREQKVATGFVRASMLNTEGGVDPEEQNWVAQLDRASTIGTAYLGSSIACAQCHNHKYDPFLQKDFYALVAFFNNAAFVPGRPGRINGAAAAAGQAGDISDNEAAAPTYREPVLDLATPEQAAARQALETQIRQLDEQMNNWPNAAALQAAWEQGILTAETAWQPVRPTRVTSMGGSTLTVASDQSILASGETPNNDTYVVEAPVPPGRLTGVRIEALPDPSLPQGGPGRDFYGSFAIQRVDIEVGPSLDALQPVVLGAPVTDSRSVVTNEGIIKVTTPQLWRVQAGLAERLPRQLIVVPEQPVTVSADSVIRVRIVQSSDIVKQLLGRFRVSITTAEEPGQVAGIPFFVRPLLRIPVAQRSAEQQQQVTRQWQAVAPELSAVRAQIEGCEDVSSVNPRLCDLGTLRRQILALKIPTTLIASENPSVAHPTTFLRVRGDYTKKGDEVPAAVPGVLGALPASSPPNRLGLARWLVSRDNPLTARVRVNQLWQSYFGRGIVETSEDFGSQGRPASHPELLDWLAVQFIESGWDQKALHRLIVTSNTYRQTSDISPALLERDQYNLLLARGPRLRVEGEMVRDIALTAAGLLSPKLGGPPVMPYQPDGFWAFNSQALDDRWVLSAGEDRYRRGLYTYVRRTARYPSLAVFDAPSHEIVVARRTTTNTPLQAFTTLNDPAFFEAAQAMAKRIRREAPGDTATTLTYGFRVVTSRTPRPSELQTLVQAFDREKARFTQHPDAAAKIAGAPDPSAAAWTMVANILMNLDETLTKE